MIWAIIPAWLKRAAAWVMAGFAAFWAIWFAAKREQRAETALEAAERYAKTREKTDHADLGAGATDLQRIERLRKFADKS